MSIMVGVGRAAQAGILVKNAEAIEGAEKVTHLITDKTGTLTTGAPEVVRLIATGETSEETLLRCAAAVEQQSEHPLAWAMCDGNFPARSRGSASLPRASVIGRGLGKRAINILRNGYFAKRR